MRVLFADGMNSVVHVLLGVGAGLFSPVVASSLFVLYQIMQEQQRNTLIDLLEFAIGWAAGRRFSD